MFDRQLLQIKGNLEAKRERLLERVDKLDDNNAAAGSIALCSPLRRRPEFGGK
jgi:hypothetical protein